MVCRTSGSSLVAWQVEQCRIPTCDQVNVSLVLECFYPLCISRRRLSETKFDDGGKVSESFWHDSFSRSRWFTCGWTAQELVAPSVLRFYDSNWVELDNKVNVGRTSPLVKQVQLYDVEQVANFRLLQIDRLLEAIVRAGYILLH
jgi:hypothetical protein